MDGGLSGSAAGVQTSLTLRLTIQGLSLWSYNSQEREFARRLQEGSGVQVSMPANNWPERNLTLSGSSDVIFRALVMIIDMIQDNIGSTLSLTEGPQPFVTLRLRVPASQCIMLLQEGDSRVRDICAHTGAQVRVCCGLPPGDNELSMTGRPHCVSECMKLICQVLLGMLAGIQQERGWVLAYQPSPRPALQNDGHDQAAEGSTSAGGHFYTTGHSCAAAAAGTPNTGSDSQVTGYPQPLPHPLEPPPPQPGSSHGLSAMFPFYGPEEQPARSCSGGASKAPEEITHELMIPNSLIGCVIGFHGANISEIRRISGAQIKIFPKEEGSSLRLVRMTGTLSSIILAHSMVIYSLNNKRH
ncbi:poly(rC)-binding protein 1-like [Sorex fumeus]|uniref:poly(rC)-binding protein 1-like n=1 Tax=Sorex fumeus TaxID=62283 RepID=UPI0024AD8151|nr:poly(rC)-binding protein 1-like [Sorex fumeus]